MNWLGWLLLIAATVALSFTLPHDAPLAQPSEDDEALAS